MKKNSLLLLLVLLMFSFSCQEKVDPLLACGVENPRENLDWLNELIEQLEITEFGRTFNYITEGIFQDQTLFVLQNCCPNCNSAPIFYDCQGNVFDTAEISIADLSEVQLIWKSEFSSCTVGE